MIVMDRGLTQLSQMDNFNKNDGGYLKNKWRLV